MRQDGDGNNRVEVRADGAIRIGPGGTTAPDTEIRRIAADTVGLASGDSLDLKSNANPFYLEIASSAPAASASMNGRLLIVDTGAARDLYYYANGQRFKLTGV